MIETLRGLIWVGVILTWDDVWEIPFACKRVHKSGRPFFLDSQRHWKLSLKRNENGSVFININIVEKRWKETALGNHLHRYRYDERSKRNYRSHSNRCDESIDYKSGKAERYGKGLSEIRNYMYAYITKWSLKKIKKRRPRWLVLQTRRHSSSQSSMKNVTQDW